jgi:beta-glucosidase
MRTPTLRRRPVAALAAATLTTSLVAAIGLGTAAASTGPLPSIEDFEGTVALSTANPGIFPFGSDAASTPQLAVVTAADRPNAPSGNHGLDVPYTVAGYGGFSDDLSAAQNWAPYAGFSFWVKGTGSGQKTEYEVKDGGTDAEHSELWQGFFTDSTAGWQHIVEPFSSLVKRADYQPTGAPSDGVLNLTSMWGFAINLPGSSTGHLVFDDFAVYGKAAPTVSAAKPFYLVAAGTTAQVPVRISTPDGAPLSAPVTVHYVLGGGTAQAGTDYTSAGGTLSFPAGTASGASKNITVTTKAGTPASEAKTIPITLTSTDATLTGAMPTVVINAHGLPYLNSALPTAQRVADLLSRMSLADKVGQMTQAERLAVGDGTDIAKYRLGSILSGGGSTPTPNTPQAWADMVDAFQTDALATPLQIPLIYGEDSVHGDNNLAGATVFPQNINMGATRDPALAKKDGQITATETRTTGPQWAFSPCVCVSRDERWGRSYEAFGEDPALVQQLETIIDGLQGDGNLAKSTSVLATAKHFLGDGGTKYGSSTTGTYTIDQGVTYATQQQVNQLYLPPYQTAVNKGVGSVMPSYSSLQIIGKDSAPIKMHGRGDQITGVLKGQLGFSGFVISDWQGIDQLGSDYKNDVKVGVNAGIDMVMVPYNYQGFTADLTQLNGTGEVTTARINDAVSRILNQKFRLGLFDHPFTDRSNIPTIGDAAHRAVARQAAAESQVLLKNQGNILPLKRNAKIYVAGSNADDTGNQSGGWTLTWQGQSGNVVPGATSILAGMKQDAPNASISYSKDASAPTTGYNLGVVVVGETPYAEGVGDVGNGHTMQLSVADRNAVDTVCGAMKCVVLDVSGRALDITGIVPEAKAVVGSFLPGSEGEGVADVLFGLKPFTGRLPLTWAKAESQLPINVGDANYDPLYPFGWGLRTDNPRSRLQSLRDQLETQKGSAGGVAALNTVLARKNWTSAGTARNASNLLALLSKVAGKLSNRYTFSQQDIVVSVARELAQAEIVSKGQAAMAATASLTANAEHSLLAGDPAAAVKGLSKAYQVAAKIRTPKPAGTASARR